MKLLICTQVMDQDHPVLGFFHRWVEEFAKHVEEVHVICLQKGKCDLPENVTVYSLGKENGKSRLKYIIKFYYYFTKIYFFAKPTHVFYHMGAILNVLAVPFYYLSPITKTKFYWWKAHGHINRFGRLAGCFVHLIFTSTSSGFPVKTSKRKIVGQAIDTDLFIPPQQNNRSKKRIIYVGRIMPIKNIELFIETLKRLQSCDAEWSARIIGPVGDEKYKNKLDKLIQQNNVRNIVFTGPLTQTQLVKEYQEACIFINTSKTNSMDKTVLESILCGCIPVTANIAFADLLEDTKLLVEDNKSILFFEAVVQATSPESNEVIDILIERIMKSHSLSSFTKRIFQHG